MPGPRSVDPEMRPTKRCVRCRNTWRTVAICLYCKGKLMPIVKKTRAQRLADEVFPLFESVDNASRNGRML